MSLHAFHPQKRDRVSEIGEPTYHRLMHELTLAGANEPASYGSGWSGLHPEHGPIVVSRVKWPARHRDHPNFAFFVECPNVEALGKMKDAINAPEDEQDPRLAGPRGSTN